MDGSTSAAATTSSVALNPTMIPGRIRWPCGPYINQNFALPDSVIHYIAKNPSTPKCYVKLSQSCKYFFEKLPILVAADMYEGGEKLCPNKSCDGFGKCCVDFEVAKISSQIWLTNGLYLNDLYCPSNFTSMLVPKLYRCDIHWLVLHQQDITFDEFKALVSSAEDVSLEGIKMTYDDGKPVMIETILSAIPNISSFYYVFDNDVSMVTSDTFKNISKLKNLQKLEKFRLDGIPEAVKVEDLSNFITNNANIKIWFGFNDDVSEEYIYQLDKFVDTVIESGIPNRYVKYSGQDQEKRKTMKNCCKFY